MRGGGVSALERWLPEYDVAERHDVAVAAPPEAVDRAIRTVSLNDVPVARALVRLRGIRHDPGGGPFLEQMSRRLGAVVVEDRPGSELAVGLVGQFWRLRGGDGARPRTPEEFARFDRPDWAKALMTFEVEPAGGGSRLATETRVRVPDRAARRRFRGYWLVVRPFSGLIRILLLRAAKRRAEASA
jgi:hypothetical protein